MSKTRKLRWFAGLGLVAAGVLAACGWWSNTATPEEARQRVEAMTYQRDGRTDLCFAVFCWHDETRSVTYVPCTPEVIARIGR